MGYSGLDEDDPFAYFDEYPEEDPFKSELQYKDEVAQKLLAAMEEYLSFSTARELIKLIAANL